MHTYKRENDKWLIGHYVPVTWINPLFGPRSVQEWETIKEVNNEDDAINLVARLNGKHENT